MKSKNSFILIALSLYCQQGSSQTLKEQFTQAFSKNDTTAEKKILSEWSKSAHDDPDRYVYAFNYYARRGMTEVMALTKQQPDSKSFVLKDKNGQVAGYLGSTLSFNQPVIAKGLACIDSAIALFPNRLDMRFGKVYLLGKVGDYDQFTSEIVKDIDYGQTIGNKWLWRDGKLLDDPEKFMLSTIQSYIRQLYGAGDNEMGNMQLIAKEVTKFYPDNVECLSDLSITYMQGKEYDKALDCLIKAEKIAPQDYIVLNNIAYCYVLKKDKPNAIKYYELVKKYGPDEAKQDADERIKKLNSE
ncbi:MAG: tetratricopeptide repeat protein [Bacteroidetes bacterium]|nr:tetratricopeptide repeat protein [Bacteroidota bacterium]